MRKIIVQMMVTMDGCYAGPNGEVDWHVADEEYMEYSLAVLRSVDGLLLGRRTYELMVDYWPTPYAREHHPEVALFMNTLPKLVVTSRHPSKTAWENTIYIQDSPVEQLRMLKKQPGKDLVILGSSELIRTIMPYHLIDEYCIIVNPIVLGKGMPLFSGIDNKVRMELTGTKAFRSGNVLLTYRHPTV
ncbi:dihydrofolate reductase family protein [Paenibacillus sp. GCM10023252]|uniref:dihydrofolate reductase family protein n=1 Tax=Paenibacillus sp. GCM10023252 TaxID=3252649 RepID=UPI0036211182